MCASEIFKAAARARGVSAKFSAKKIDRGWKKILTAVKSIRADKSFVKAGLLGPKANKNRSAASPGKTAPTNVQIGIWNEFGTVSAPARPFIRPAFERSRAEYMNLLALFVKAHVMTGRRNYVQTLALIGQRMAADMKNYVTQGPQIPPPNAPAYLAEKIRRGYWKQQRGRRNTNKPVVEGPLPPPRTLVDTGSMVNSITYGVVARGTSDLRKRSAP